MAGTNKYDAVESVLRQFKLNKARIGFLEKHLDRLNIGPDENDIFHGMLTDVRYSNLSEIVFKDRIGLKFKDTVEETAVAYCDDGISRNDTAAVILKKELALLGYVTGMIEDALNLVEKVDSRYRTIIEQHFINNMRMEEIADRIHLSRTTCYELRREALRSFTGVLCGEELYIPKKADSVLRELVSG